MTFNYQKADPDILLELAEDASRAGMAPEGGPAASHGGGLTFWPADEPPPAARRKFDPLIKDEWLGIDDTAQPELEEADGSVAVHIWDSFTAEERKWFGHQVATHGVAWTSSAIQLAADAGVQIGDLAARCGFSGSPLATIDEIAAPSRDWASDTELIEAICDAAPDQNPDPMSDDLWTDAALDLRRRYRKPELADGHEWWDELIDAAEHNAELRWPLYVFAKRMWNFELPPSLLRRWASRWGGYEHSDRMIQHSLLLAVLETREKQESSWQSIPDELALEYFRFLEEQIDVANSIPSAKKWWTAFKSENEGKIARLAQLAWEVSHRGADLNAFYYAYVYSNCDRVQANLYYLDYTIARDREKKEWTDKDVPANSVTFLDEPEPLTGRTPKQWADLIEQYKIRLDFDSTKGSARNWWRNLEKHHSKEMLAEIALRLADTQTTITKAFLAFVYSNARSVEAVIAYLRYSVEKDKEKKT